MSDPLPNIALITLDPTLSLTGLEGATASIKRVSWSADDGPLTPQQLRDEIQYSGALTAAMGPDVPEALALDVAQLLDEALEPTGVILLRTPTADLWREAARSGVREVVDPLSGAGEIRRALLAEATRVTRIRSAREDLVVDPGPHGGKIIVVLSPKGGSGKTMLASNLAVGLATSQASEVALVDLDCVFGDVASVLGLVPERTIGQLAMLPTVDSTVVKVFLTRHTQSGLYVLAGSGLPEEGEAVTPEIATQVLTTLARDVGHVVVDTAAGLDERALAAVDIATDLILLASLDVASIRNLGKEIDALDRMGTSKARRHFVLNRADARVGLEVADVEAAIGMKAAAALPSSRAVPLSMNQGRLLVLDEPESPVAKQLLGLVRLFLNEEETALSQERRNRFFRRRSP